VCLSARMHLMIACCESRGESVNVRAHHAGCSAQDTASSVAHVEQAELSRPVRCVLGDCAIVNVRAH
jgi:hypothetical protein